MARLGLLNVGRGSAFAVPSTACLGLSAALLVASLIACARDMKKDCNAVFDPLFREGTSALYRTPRKRAEVDDVVAHLTEGRTRLQQARPSIGDAAVAKRAEKLDQLLEQRIALVRTAYEGVPEVPSHSPAPPPTTVEEARRQALLDAVDEAAKGLTGGDFMARGKAAALHKNMEAMEEERAGFVEVCVKWLR